MKINKNWREFVAGWSWASSTYHNMSNDSIEQQLCWNSADRGESHSSWSVPFTSAGYIKVCWAIWLYIRNHTIFFIKSLFKHTRKSFSVLTSFCFDWPCDLSFTAPTLYFSACWFFPLTREQNMLTKIRNNCKSVSFTADTVKASCFGFFLAFCCVLNARKACNSIPDDAFIKI